MKLLKAVALMLVLGLCVSGPIPAQAQPVEVCVGGSTHLTLEAGAQSNLCWRALPANQGVIGYKIYMATTPGGYDLEGAPHMTLDLSGCDENECNAPPETHDVIGDFYFVVAGYTVTEPRGPISDEVHLTVNPAPIGKPGGCALMPR